MKETLSGRIFRSDNSVMGDIITIVMDIKELGFRDALKLMHDILDLPFTMNYKPEQKKYNPLEVFKRVKSYCSNSDYSFKTYDENVLSDINYTRLPHINLIKEGISPKVQEEFGITYCSRQNRILFPHRHWSSGEILGIFGRTTVEIYEILGIPKYFGVIGYPKSMNLYGLYENYEEIIKSNAVIIVEGEKSVLKLKSMNYGNAVALGGHEMSLEQIKILISLNVDIIFALDKDLDKQISIDMCNEFKGIRNTFYIDDKYDILGEKDAPVDKGLKVWNYLYKNKVKVD